MNEYYSDNQAHAFLIFMFQDNYYDPISFAKTCLYAGKCGKGCPLCVLATTILIYNYEHFIHQFCICLFQFPYLFIENI